MPKPDWVEPDPKPTRPERVKEKAKRRLRAKRVPRNELTRSVEAIRDRSGGGCEAWWPHDCTGPMEVHHLLMRSQGGGHDPENLLLVCRAAHSWIHHAGAEAYRIGALRRRPADERRHIA